MHRARVKTSGAPVFAKEIDRKPTWRGQDLVCWEDGCDSNVGEVEGYVKRDGTPCGAYFRLKKNEKHAPGCAWNPDEAIESIAQGAEGLAAVTKDGVLRLTLPQDLGAPPAPTSGPDTAPVTGPVVEHKITTGPPKLPPLLNSAVKIVRFLIAHDFDDKIVNRFKVLPFNGRSPIPWSSFCYGPDYTSYTALYLQRRSRKKPPHPVAVYGTVQRIERDKANNRPYAVLATADPAGLERFDVVLRSDHPSLITPLREGTHVLAVGSWKVWSPQHRTPQLVLFAEDHFQIAYWASDSTTGTLSDPAAPPALPPSKRYAATAGRPASRRAGPDAKGAAQRQRPPGTATASRPQKAPASRSPRRPMPARDAAPPPAHERKRPVLDPPGPSATPEPPAPAGSSQHSPGQGRSPSGADTPAAPTPPLPPRPTRPPRPADPLPHRRKRGLPGWLKPSRRKRR